MATSTCKPLSIIVAATKSGGIGAKGTIPWKLPGDMAYFKRITSATSKPSSQNAVIMGRKTWESIPEKFRPLPQRLNIVLTSKGSPELSEASKKFPNVKIAADVQKALEMVDNSSLVNHIDQVFVIGGAQVYTEVLTLARCKTVYLTRIESDIDCDVRIPDIDMRHFKEESVSPEQEENNIRYRFYVYKRISGSSPNTPEKDKAQADSTTETKEAASSSSSSSSSAIKNTEEQQYLDLIRDIIQSGIRKGDRTGVGTISKFGCTMRFSLRDNKFPLLTTKRVFWRGVAEELIWFISGSTNAKILSDKGIKIWDGNGSKEYLSSIGLGHREEMDLGPVYGFQWRHFGAEYKTMHDDYTGQGVDQLANVINTIKNNPNDRRIILSAWNPAALKEMALPPCHMFCQFYVADGELSCQMYQRSCDMGLGVPFNIASYSLLTRLIAQVCGLKAGDFIHVLGDAHVYSNHVEPLLKQLEREPRQFPTLEIDPSIKNIDDFRFEHFTITGYKPHPKLPMKMAV